MFDQSTCSGRSAGVWVAVVASLVLAAGAEAQGLPELPYIIPNDCQLECCRLGDWHTTFAPLPVAKGPIDTQRVAVIPPRTAFHVDSTVIVVRQAGVAVVTKPVRMQQYSRDSTMLMPGDTVYLLNYEGNDSFRAVVHGKIQYVDGFWGAGGPGMGKPADTPSYGKVLREEVTEWWVRVARPAKYVGWANMTQVQSVAGPDACSEGD